jgi:hypothetical protein
MKKGKSGGVSGHLLDLMSVATVLLLFVGLCFR